MPDHMTNEPSAEAVEAAIRHRLTRGGCCPYCSPHGTIEEGPAGATWTVPCEHGGIAQQARRYLTAAYAIDAPRFHAAGQSAGVEQVRNLIGYVEQAYAGDGGARAEGARAALCYLRTQLDLRFGAEEPPCPTK